MRVSRKWKIRIGKFLSFVDYLVCELEYRIIRLVYIIETPRVIREAELLLHKAEIIYELDHDDGGEWDGDLEPEWDDYYDGREWWLRDQDNPGDR